MVRICLLALVVLVVGCQNHHYVVLEETPFYASVEGEVVLDTLPRYHHQELEAVSEAQRERVQLAYKGRRGYASLDSVKVFSYLTPLIDGGTDRDSKIRGELREAQLAHVGADWSASTLQAIRDEQVVKGMSRRQVELAWGWPLTVGPGSLEGGERWVFRFESHTTVRRFLMDPWAYPSSFSPHPLTCWDTRPRSLRRELGWRSVRLPVTEERVVELDANGRVHSLSVRRFVSDI